MSDITGYGEAARCPEEPAHYPEEAARCPEDTSHYPGEPSRYPEEPSRCPVCPHSCYLKPGDTGLCRARHNKGGNIVPVSYGTLTAIALDPIEKKPLANFMPGY
nr:hypothetical protein [Lachnospiraceae bacterium]